MVAYAVVQACNNRAGRPDGPNCHGKRKGLEATSARNGTVGTAPGKEAQAQDGRAGEGRNEAVLVGESGD